MHLLVGSDAKGSAVPVPAVKGWTLHGLEDYDYNKVYPGAFKQTAAMLEMLNRSAHHGTVEGFDEITDAVARNVVYKIQNQINQAGIGALDEFAEISDRTHGISYEEDAPEPPKRKTGIKVASVAELVQKLKNEAKVI